MQLVQTRTRLATPLVTAFTVCRLGFHRRRVTLCACEMLFPNCGPLPQNSHTCAITNLQNLPNLCRNLADLPILPGVPAGTYQEENGRHDWIRTNDLYRVKVAL